MSSSLSPEDRALFESLGTILTDESILGGLPRAMKREAVLEDLSQMFISGDSKCVVLTGDSGTGKTAIIYELAHLLKQLDSGWEIVQVTPTEFLKGTRYLGEWETQLAKVVEAASSPKQIILYIPALHEIVSVGRASNSDNNIASALIPHLEQGRLAVIGESSEEELEEAFAASPALKRLFQQLRLKSTDDEQTKSIAAEVITQSDLEPTPAFLDRLFELSEFSQAGLANPGRIISLLRQVLKVRSDETRLPTDQEILSIIEKSTGVSTHLLDDQVTLKLPEIREFFESRVIGQPEAATAAVDLITLIKSRLTDPGKPYGVMLFVGPTGVGKTEMARSLAEYCFGNEKRLSRIDMSEFSTYDAFERLNGARGKTGVLTSIVRKQPFSIILLDEIEKAHINVFDLCLQIFDAGRLTDGQGKLADFRRSIIIMTSNVGAQLSDNPAFGFGQNEEEQSLDTEIHRELGHTFRPEFINRIDRVVVFRPLSKDTAEKIARLEVNRVLQRSGVTGRNLTIDVAPEIYPLLLREGYSRTFGARPLKRVIERLVLMPLARKLVTGSVRPESIVHFSCGKRQISISVESPDNEPIVNPDAKQTLERDALEAIRDQVELLKDLSLQWATRKTNLLARTATPGFWDNREEAEAISDEIYKIESATKQIGHLRRQIDRNASRQPTQDVLANLEIQTELLKQFHAEGDSLFFGDTFLILSALGHKGEPQQGVFKLAQMYQRWAKRFRIDCRVLSDLLAESPHSDSIILHFSGFGAAAYLFEERGIHELIKVDETTNSKMRERIRIDSIPIDTRQPDLPKDDISISVQTVRGVRGRLLDRPQWSVRVVHNPSMISLNLQTDGDRDEMEELCLSLLNSYVHAREENDANEDSRMNRIYQQGRAGIVRDRKTKLRSGHVDRIFGGYIDRFLLLPFEDQNPESESQ